MVAIDAKLCAYAYTSRELDFFDMQIRLYIKEREERYAAKRLARASREGR